MIKFALLGCGRIAKRHADLLESGQINNAQLVSVCDVVPDRAKLFGEKYHVPFYFKLERMMQEQDDIDVVSVLTPSGLHAEHTIGVAEFGKHVVVEKPMALTLESADDMIRQCDAARVKLFVVKQNRYNLPVQKLREAIERKRFGKLVMGTARVRWCRTQEYYNQDGWRGTWSMDGGVFTNQASHHIDLLEWMMGEPESVFAKAITALVDIETEDTGVAVIRFRNGALGVVEATTAARPKDLEASISIMGEKGSVEIGGFAANEMRVWNFLEPEPEDELVIEQFHQNPPNVYGFGHAAYFQQVVEAIDADKPALVDGLEGRKSLELITALYESIETGKEVFLRFKPKMCRLGREYA
jgi:UDP-N-acetyl-2-amino-2-deoxyglucuronate dehydrogenase